MGVRIRIIRNCIFAVLALTMFVSVIVFFECYDARQWRRANEPYRSLYFTTGSGGGHDIELVCIDDRYYAFIPSEYGTQPVVGLRYADSVIIDDTEYHSGDVIERQVFSGDSEGPSFVHISVQEHSGSICEGDICFLSAGDIPSLYIDTQSGSMDGITASEDHSYTEQADMYCMDPEHPYSGRCSIRGRGNTTWRHFPKNPYNIEFDKPVPLMGMGAQFKWTLLANIYDGAQMRNYLALDVARRMDMPASVECRYANLYLNGEYAGLYLVTQHIDVTGGMVPIHDLGAENRNINDYTQPPEWDVYSDPNWRSIEWFEGESPTDISGGYLIEFVQYGTPGSGFFTTYHNMGIIESPKYHTYDESVYMLEYLLKIEDLIFNDQSDAYAGYIDKDSWAVMYLLEEFFANEDTDLYSLYAYKDRGSDMLVCGPAWDFDATMGIDREDGYCDTYDMRWLRSKADEYKADGHDEGWLNELYEGHADFRQTVLSEYKDRFSVIISDEIDTVAPGIHDMIAKSAYMDHIRYPHRMRPGYDEGFEADYDHMLTWLKARLEYSDNYYGAITE